MSLITALLVVGGMGALWALLLTFTAQKTHVHVNQNLEKINAALPGCDCQACGFKTCKAYAAAIAGSRTSVYGCAAGGPKTAHAIGDILEVPVTMPDQMVAVVHCKGGKRETLDRYRYDGIADYHAVMIAGNGDKLCADGCLGL
ncbi:MAG: (Fe-S)-binding protein, partial [Chitinivibrionales bacterium]|nr:(Fe-S)-binding protein [Chitinivibrionales bacterium]